MSQSKRLRADVTPEEEGVFLRIGEKQVHIPDGLLLEVIESLSYWLKPSAPEVKAFLMKLATQHGIYTEDLFPVESVVVSDLLAEADRCLEGVEVQQ